MTAQYLLELPQLPVKYETEYMRHYRHTMNCMFQTETDLHYCPWQNPLSGCLSQNFSTAFAKFPLFRDAAHFLLLLYDYRRRKGQINAHVTFPAPPPLSSPPFSANFSGMSQSQLARLAAGVETRCNESGHVTDPDIRNREKANYSQYRTRDTHWPALVLKELPYTELDIWDIEVGAPTAGARRALARQCRKVALFLFFFAHRHTATSTTGSFDLQVDPYVFISASAVANTPTTKISVREDN